MSIKRSKPRTSGSRNSGPEADNYFAKPTEPEKTWAEHVEGKTDDQFAPYAMTTRFTKGALLVHSKFGKGVVVGVEQTHVEVLFETGTKKLGHGATA
jgi:hypothetical protein